MVREWSDWGVSLGYFIQKVRVNCLSLDTLPFTGRAQVGRLFSTVTLGLSTVDRGHENR